jgi:hypothetical protein
MSVAEAVQTTAKPQSSSVSSLFLQHKCACGGSASFSGECEECKSKNLLGKPLQRKLAINEPGDEYEREADRVAEQVMRMVVSRNEKDASTTTAAVPLVQRKLSADSTGIATAPPIVHDVLSSQGQPLDPATRAFFELRFGHDFGNVRVHADTKATESAQAVGARAFTVGQHIAFADRSYEPATESGRELLAHELTHIVQQGHSSTHKDVIRRRNDMYYESYSWADKGAADVVLPTVDTVRSTPGRTLDGPTRAFFESHFGHDFTSVRIHADAAAAQSAVDLNAHAYTLGKDVVFGAGQYQAATDNGKRLLAHELAHVLQQQGSANAMGVLQRSPIFPDTSCDRGKIKEKISEYVAIALDLVKQTVALLSNPDQVAGPLRRFFHFDPTIPGQMLAAPRVLPTLRNNLEKLQAELEAPVDSHCETGDAVRGSRGGAKFDRDTGLVIREAGITYNRNTLRMITLPRQIVNTIIHEYAHLANVGHHQPPGEPISNEDSTKVRGLTTLEALNNAESYMRFVRAVTSEPLITLTRRELLAENAPRQSGEKFQSTSTEPQATEHSSCASLDQLVPPRFPEAESEERSTLEAYYPGLQGNCFRVLRGGDDSCFGYCLHRVAGGDPLSKGVNLPIPPTIDEFERAFATYYEPIIIEAVDAANQPADAVLALFARGETPAHVACRSDIQYESQYLWESKVSPVFPLILHHLSDLEGGAAGDVVRLYKRRAVEQP